MKEIKKIDADAEGFIVKPFNPEWILETVKSDWMMTEQGTVNP